MFEDFSEKIKLISLSKTDKLIADYLMEHRSQVGMQTVSNLAVEIGVSDTSIIRFVRKLGFSSYSDFKRQSNEWVRKQYSEILSPSEKYRRTKGMIDQEDLISAVANRVIDNLHKSCKDLDIATINKVAEILLNAQRRYVAGFRGTSCCSNYIFRKLVLFLPNVVCFDEADSSVIEQMMDIGPQDTLLLYSFPRYSELSHSLLEIAKKREATSILITDRITSPLVPLADVVLPVAVEGLGLTNSYAVPMCVSEMIILAISEQMDISNGERFQEIDHYIEKNKLY